MSDSNPGNEYIGIRELCRQACSGDSESIKSVFEKLRCRLEPIYKGRITTPLGHRDFEDFYQEWCVELLRSDRKVLCKAADAKNDKHAFHLLLQVFRYDVVDAARKRRDSPTSIQVDDVALLSGSQGPDSETLLADLAGSLTQMELRVLILRLRGYEQKDIAMDPIVNEHASSVTVGRISHIVRQIKVKLGKLI